MLSRGYGGVLELQCLCLFAQLFGSLGYYNEPWELLRQQSVSNVYVTLFLKWVLMTFHLVSSPDSIPWVWVDGPLGYGGRAVSVFLVRQKSLGPFLNKVRCSHVGVDVVPMQMWMWC